MDTQPFLMQVRFSAWATRRVLDSVAAIPPDELRRNLGGSYENIYDTLAHIYQADSIWWDRLMLKPTTNLDVYAPPDELPELSRKWLGVLDTYVSWAETLPAAGWDQIVPHTNIKGEPFKAPVWQIVLHVVNHASYHRGQVTNMLRQLGRAPTGTDLIAYYRSL